MQALQENVIGCEKCHQPLEEWEAGFCEGCVMKNAMQQIKQAMEPNRAAKPTRGRPPTERGAYNALPGRKFGRVSDADWQEIRDACELSGLSLVAWALPLLLSKARRAKSKGRKPGADRGEK